MLNMTIDNSIIDGALVVLGMLGVLVLGISSVALSPPPASYPLKSLKEEHPIEILTARELWGL